MKENLVRLALGCVLVAAFAGVTWFAKSSKASPPAYVQPVQPGPVTVQFPLFTASGRQAGADNELARQLLDEVKALRVEVKALRAELAAGRSGGQAVAEARDYLDVVKNRCASCHSAEVAEDKGKGLVLIEIDGSLPPLSIDQAADIVSKVKAGAMPPKSPLPPREKQLVLEALLQKEK